MSPLSQKFSKLWPFLWVKLWRNNKFIKFSNPKISLFFWDLDHFFSHVKSIYISESIYKVSRSNNNLEPLNDRVKMFLELLWWFWIQNWVISAPFGSEMTYLGRIVTYLCEFSLVSQHVLRVTSKKYLFQISSDEVKMKMNQLHNWYCELWSELKYFLEVFSPNGEHECF